MPTQGPDPSLRLVEDDPAAGSPASPASSLAGHPDEAFLVASVRGGDAAALSRLMERYDRLVRYSIFRTARLESERDPQWLDSLASETWTGFVQSLQRHPETTPQRVSTYLIQIARNKTLSSLRQRRPAAESLDDSTSGAEAVAAEDEDPLAHAARMEELAALRDCVAGLPAAEQAILGQLGPITERSWGQAAAALGVPESTLRSRWKNIIQALTRCLSSKPAGKSLARKHDGSDT
jgi:RNA polymerase sigma factor (sigma-70 family)